MEIASQQTLDSLSKLLKEYKETQTAHIKEFCEVKLQELQSDLDSFQYHAQEILHTEIFGSEIPNTRARYVPPPSQAIPVEEEPKTPDHRRAQAAGAPLSTPVDPPPHTPATTLPEHTPGTTKRWTNVDYASFTKARQRSPSPVPLRPSQPYTHGRDTNQQGSEMGPSDSAEPYVAQREAETYIAQLRKAHTPMQLRGQDRQAVVTWYNSFVDFLKTYRVPIKIFDELQASRLEDPDEHIYPSVLESDPHHCNRFGAAIYAKLEEDQVLDPDNQLNMGLLRIHNSN